MRGPLLTAVGEDHRAGQPVAATRPVGEMHQRGGQLDLAPALLRMHHDGAIAKRIRCVAIGGEEQPLGLPAGPPLPFGELGLVEGVALLGEPSAAAAH
jgi:hypothetical protein